MEVPRHWRLKDQRYRLEGNIDPKTGQPQFPKRAVPIDFLSSTPRENVQHVADEALQTDILTSAQVKVY